VLPQTGLMATLLSMIAPLSILPPTFTTRAARTLGMHPRDLYRLRDAGEVIELSRGVFRRADAPTASMPDLLAVASRVPIGIVCCVSALFAYDLTDEIPSAVQIAVPRRQRPPHIAFPATFELGLSTVEAAPEEHVRIYRAERTIVDLMRLRGRLGQPLVFAALRRYLRRRDARPGELLSFARALGVLGPMRTALDLGGQE